MVTQNARNVISVLSMNTMINSPTRLHNFLKPTRTNMNARGIPTAAYQVLHLLSYTRGVTSSLDGGFSHHGVPPSGPGQVTSVWTWPEYPLPGENRLKTLPFPILRMRSVINANVSTFSGNGLDLSSVLEQVDVILEVDRFILFTFSTHHKSCGSEY